LDYDVDSIEGSPQDSARELTQMSGSNEFRALLTAFEVAASAPARIFSGERIWRGIDIVRLIIVTRASIQIERKRDEHSEQYWNG
jgi:hypothetical protein